jgi:heme-degrading monooxygenase HmoA
VHAVIFEFGPFPDRREAYLGLAKLLRPELERVEGFLENERFESLATPGRLLSLSTWRDEAALVRWRKHALHHKAQARGREEILAGYRLRVGEVVEEGSPDWAGAGRALTVTVADGLGTGALAAALDAPVAPELFASLYTPERLAALVSWRDAGAAGAWLRTCGDPGLTHRLVRVIRDYGMEDRAEAPQRFPPTRPRPAAC